MTRRVLVTTRRRREDTPRGRETLQQAMNSTRCIYTSTQRNFCTCWLENKTAKRRDNHDSGEEKKKKRTTKRRD